MDSFYHKKLKSSIDVLAIMASEAGIEEYISQFLKMSAHPQIISNNLIVEHLFYDRIGRLCPTSTVFYEFLDFSNISARLSQIGFNSTNIMDNQEHELMILERQLDTCLYKVQHSSPQLAQLLDPPLQ